MAVVVVAIAILGIVMTETLPAWSHDNTREKEYELAFRGEQYARAIALYQRANRTYPTSLDQLVDGHFLRKKWKDPITGLDFDYRYGAQPSSTPTSPTPGRGGTPTGGSTPARGGTPTGGGSAPAGGGGTPARSGSTPGSAGGSSGTPGTAGGAPPVTGGPIMGVMSKSTDTSIRVYNGATHYNEWQFVAVLPAQAPAAGGQPGRGTGPGATGPGGTGPAGTGPGRAGPGGTGPGRGGTGPGRGAGPGTTGPGRGATPPTAPTSAPAPIGRGRGGE